jgi:hypothetical protein
MRFLHKHSLVYYFLNHSIYQKLAGGKIEELNEQQINALSPDQRQTLYRRLIGRMRTITEGHGAELLVVFAYQRSDLRPNRQSPHQTIREQLEANGIRTLDLYDVLRDAELGSDSSYYYQTDIHWNTRGHRLVAELLRPWLLQVVTDTTVRGSAAPY